MSKHKIGGFSKLSKSEKLAWIASLLEESGSDAEALLRSFDHPDLGVQGVLDGFSENTVSNFPLPFGVAPNFLINGRYYTVPMVIEESSVVAAASNAAKFWAERGGFHAEVVSMDKVGQVHFYWYGQEARWKMLEPALNEKLLQRVDVMTANMRERGGGIKDLKWLNLSQLDPNYRQLQVTFDTCDSMGANFINSVLEEFAQGLECFLDEAEGLSAEERRVEVVMSILSNYTPDCRVSVQVACDVEELGDFPGGMKAEQFAEKFERAVRIAGLDPYRAVTHNKGIYNGIDAVVLATGNDFRAIEACGHAYAARDGQYRSLSSCRVENGRFHFSIEVPMAVGTVGGLTALHPLAKLSLELLGKPSAEELMQIIGAMGLAQNFSALRSLVTTGIQYGHMKMHLQNILQHLGANPDETAAAKLYFCNRTVSFAAVRDFINTRRSASV